MSHKERQLDFFAGAHPASPSPSPGSARDWMIRAATWPSSFLGLLTATGPAGWFGRTSPESCQWTEEGLLAPSSGGWRNSGMASAGESLTLSTPEFHSAAAASSLPDILETGGLPARYYLSPRTCAGILRRAERR